MIVMEEGKYILTTGTGFKDWEIGFSGVFSVYKQGITLRPCLVHPHI